MAIAKRDVLELAEGGTVYLADAADLEAWLAAFNDLSRHRCDGDGRLVIWMPPAFPPCSELALELMLRLARAIDAAGLPIRRFGADARFLLDPQGERWVTPDGALVRRSRITPQVAALTSGAWPVVPDLAIEVLSPSDQAELSDRKIGLYRAARTPRLWVIDPRSRTVAVWRQGALGATLTEPDDELELEDLVPGWRLPLRELWALSDG